MSDFRFPGVPIKVLTISGPRPSQHKSNLALTLALEEAARRRVPMVFTDERSRAQHLLSRDLNLTIHTSQHNTESTNMMPMPGQSVDQYLKTLAAISGEGAPRATPDEIERLKALGFKISSFKEYGDTWYAWFREGTDDFQDVEPSCTESDAWACALSFAKHKGLL